jgi:hypothetical protein
LNQNIEATHNEPTCTLYFYVRIIFYLFPHMAYIAACQPVASQNKSINQIDRASFPSKHEKGTLRIISPDGV